MADAVKKAPAKTTAPTLPKEVFAVEVANHDLIKRTYEAYLANGRENFAVVKTRGLVRGGGKKPWQQKGTGRARFGSSRNPIWRGGGIVFGPTGNENYTKTVPVAQKRRALRQALTLANQSKKIIVAKFAVKDGKTKETIKFLETQKAVRRVLLVVESKDELTIRATANVPNLKVVQATYLNVYDVMNADSIIIDPKSLDLIKDWLTRPVKGGSDA